MTTIVQTGPTDREGKTPYTAFWRVPNGVFRPGHGTKGLEPVGYRRAQVFRTEWPQAKITSGEYVVCQTEAEAELRGHEGGAATPAEVLRGIESME